MGFFSWKTQDTDRSIANRYSCKETFTVYMIDDKGNTWKDDSYDGYGNFDGKDYYELLAEMNGADADRDVGIALAFSGSPSGRNPKIKFPNLVEDPAGWTYTPDAPESCDWQGYFYNEDDCDDDDPFDYDED